MRERDPVRVPEPGQVGGEPLEEVTNRHNPKSTLSQGREKAARRGQAPPWVLPAGLCCPLLAPAAVRRQEEKSETQLL